MPLRGKVRVAPQPALKCWTLHRSMSLPLSCLRRSFFVLHRPHIHDAQRTCPWLNIPSRKPAETRYRSRGFQASEIRGVQVLGRLGFGQLGFTGGGVHRYNFPGAASPGAALLAPAGQGARRPPRLERVRSVVLPPSRAILSQGEENGISLRRCVALRARDAAGVRIRRCLPCGQRRCRWARRIMAHRGKKQDFGAFCPSGNVPGAPGNGAAARFPTKGTEIHAIPQTRRILIPTLLQHQPRAANAALYKPRLIPPAFRGEHSARAQAQLSAPFPTLLRP